MRPEVDVSSETLWAPWRLAYIKGDDRPAHATDLVQWLPGADRECFICRAVAEQRDRENLLVHRGRETVCVLNRYPYNNGHLLVAPRLHKGRLNELSEGEQLESQQEIARLVGLIERLMNAEGFNIGLNLGRTAGAGLPGHLHWHVVPRWNGDTNFMPVLSATKVIPQALDCLWELLSTALGTEAASQKSP
jgi:ATP adenylyltransferase